MATPSYKLVDYTVPTPGDLARLILEYAGKPFEDVRVSTSAAAELEAKSPYGKLPYLEVDGKLVGHNLGMCRYLARRHGLAGDTPEHDARCDMIIEGLIEMSHRANSRMVENLSADEKLDLIIDMINTEVPIYLAHLEEMLKKKGDSHFVGDKVTWADLGVTLALALLQFHEDSVLEHYPTLEAFLETMLSQEPVRIFLEKKAAAVADS